MLPRLVDNVYFKVLLVFFAALIGGLATLTIDAVMRWLG